LEGTTPNLCRKAFYREVRDNKPAQSLVNPPKILILDIETSQLHAKIWRPGQQYVTADRVIKDWSILSWSAKWLGSPEDKVMYSDTRNEKDPRNDKKIVKQIWDLMEEADIILTQNGKKFDEPKLKARFNFYKLGMPSHYEHWDALKIARKHLGEISLSLGFVTKKFCKKFTKSGHKKFPGVALWDACEDKNIEAFMEMEDYNKIDVLSLEEWYVDHLRHLHAPNINIYNPSEDFFCACGSSSFTELKPIPRVTKPLRQVRCKVCKAIYKIKK
jgi:DNA polymerase III epsilon subunit-like protein